MCTALVYIEGEPSRRAQCGTKRGGSCNRRATVGLGGRRRGKDARYCSPYRGDCTAGCRTRRNFGDYLYQQSGGGDALAPTCAGRHHPWTLRIDLPLAWITGYKRKRESTWV